MNLLRLLHENPVGDPVTDADHDFVTLRGSDWQGPTTKVRLGDHFYLARSTI